MLPRPGQRATVLHLDAREEVTVLEVRDGGRELAVQTADGERLTFTLRRATAVYTATADSAWPRLVLDA